MNRRIVEYFVIAEGTVRELNDSVQKAIKESWQPFGSFSFQPFGSIFQVVPFCQYCQPMVKYQMTSQEESQMITDEAVRRKTDATWLDHLAIGPIPEKEGGNKDESQNR